MLPLLFSLLSVLVISSLSLLGLLFIFVKTTALSRSTLYLVSLAVGSLLGDAFIHILPEAFKGSLPSTTVSLLSVFGILIFFSIEKFFRWQHCHDPECADSDHQHVVAINLLGDTIHNFVDGLLVAASFSVSAQVGFATAISVFIHEVPQELGHFGILLHQGVSLKKSILYNFLSAMSSFLGVAVIFTLKSSVALLPSFILPITAGGFIYLASSDLIPELHRQQPFLKDSVVQILCIIAGIILMLSLLAIG